MFFFFLFHLGSFAEHRNGSWAVSDAPEIQHIHF